MYLDAAFRESTANFNLTAINFYKELGIAPNRSGAWVIKEALLVRERSEVHVYIEYMGKKALCPLSGEMCRIHSHIKERTWRHLDTMHHTTWLHCSVPRVMNKACKVTTVEVPWAGYSKRFTRSFAAAVAAMIYRNKSQSRTAAIFRTTKRVVHAIMKSAGNGYVNDRATTVPVEKTGIDAPSLVRYPKDHQRLLSNNPIKIT